MKRKLYFVLVLLAVVVFPVAGQGINRLWGLMPTGGNPGLGTMFSTDGAGRNLVTHLNFPDGIPGARPVATRLLPYNGSFYGLTSEGGLEGEGVLFSWDPVQLKYTRHYEFRNESGGVPFGSLVVSGGKFYGMTSEGGENDRGVIFSWDPVTSVYTKVFDFSDASGETPLGSLIAVGGKLYGMTSLGGENSVGVIFEWDPLEEKLNILHNFSGTDGAHPAGDLLFLDGKFYGMTVEGGIHDPGYGVIFELDNGTYNVLHHFNDSDGSFPAGSLIVYDGKLFGVTSKGGTEDGGVLFEWDNGNFAVRYEFSEDDGHRPFGTLEVKDDKLYGLTSEGGAHDGGVIFEWDPDPESFDYTPRYEFEESTGWKPSGSMLLAGGKFFGLTYAGGSIDSGVLFEWNPDTDVYTDRTIFSEGLVTGILPMSNVTFLDGKLFATTAYDLLTFGGSIFEWDPENRQYSVRYTFDPEDGIGLPYGAMIEKDGKFYGLTGAGGVHEAGVIFEWDPVTKELTKRHDLPEGFGSGICESFLLLNGKFYGVSSSYGDEENGLFFEWDPDANDGAGEFIERHLFTSASAEEYGLLPAGIAVKDGKIYGTTSAGGLNDNGIIFEWDPELSAFSKKLDLDILNGAEIFFTGAMTLKDGIFYGTALVWDPIISEERGILYAWDPDPETNLFTEQFDFTDADEEVQPFGMLSVNNGKLYGMAAPGCDCETGSGFIYEWDPARARFTRGADLGENAEGVFPYLLPPFTRLVPVPVPVSEGQPGECIPFTVTIDESNSDEWVPVTDADGNAVAEINANGNELGNVVVSVYIHDGAVREDGGKRLYLDRNITITPEHATLQPGTEVGIRLYIRTEELDALANALNSDDQPSGVTDIDDLGVFKNESDECNGTLGMTATPVEALAESWLRGYVLQTSVTSFSTFYFASSGHSALPVRLVSFRAGIEDTNGVLTWQTAEETGFSHIEVERSLDARTFAFIGSRTAQGIENNGHYTFVDPGVAEKAANTVYYRLKLVDLDGRFGYSQIVAADLYRGTSPVYVYPNPTVETLYVRMNAGDKVRWQIVDLSGRRVKSGDESGAGLQIRVRDLPPGIYQLILTGQQKRETFRFVKR